jgi:predicted DNA-binding transcriptional regulator AlpA
MQLAESAPAITRTGASVLSEYLSDKELANELNVSPRTLARWRRLREGPPLTRIGRKIAYRRSAVAAWLASREVEVA